MVRIFYSLAVLNYAALLATFVVGAWSRERGAVHNPHDHTFLVHFILGLFSAVLTLMVHCLIFTYFLGTGRWVKEVGIAYALPDHPYPKRTRELKRSTFPPALVAMLITIAAAAAGAGAQLKAWPWQIHLSLACATIFINLWAFRVELRAVAENARIIDNVMAEVDRIRLDRGLRSNAEELLAKDEA